MPLSPAQQRRNVLCLGADMTLFMVAVGLVSQVTLVPLFVSKLTDSPLAIGALAAVFQLGWLPQLVAAGYYERSSNKRRWLIGFSLLERLPAVALAVCALIATSVATPVVLGLVYLSRFGQTVLSGPAAAAWLDYVARAVPEGRRGNFLGVSTTLGNLGGAVLAALAAPLLEWLPFPYGFAACFALGALILLVGSVPLFGVVDPPGPPPRPGQTWRDQLADLAVLLRADEPFRRFLSGVSLATLGTMGTGFVVVYGVVRHGASDEEAARYTAALLVGQVVANLLLGALADRRGLSSVGRATALAGVAMGGLVLLAPDAAWLTIAFVMLGVSYSGIMLARLAGPMSFAPTDRRPTYIALTSALTSLVGAFAPLLAGQLVALAGFEWMFGLGLVLCLLSLPFFAPAAPLASAQPSPLTTGGAD